ncbi:hypothetical protein ACLK1T_19335 [Escherichia coli]
MRTSRRGFNDFRGRRLPAPAGMTRGLIRGSRCVRACSRASGDKPVFDLVFHHHGSGSVPRASGDNRRTAGEAGGLGVSVSRASGDDPFFYRPPQRRWQIRVPRASGDGPG